MPGKQAEVTWPASVASKILNKRLGSSNFVADYPNYTEPLMGISTIDDQSSLTIDETLLNDHKDTEKHKVFVSTWNVGGIAPDEGLNIKDLLETCNNSCDIFVLGFQEVVPLKASNVLGPENSKISMKWNSIIREALNKRTHNKVPRDSTKKKELKNICPNEDGNYPAQYYKEAPQDFQCIISKQMGSVSVRFLLHETSFCFVCSHLASGGREGDEKHRNSDVAEIFSRTNFPRGPLLDLPRKILDHDHVILLGDLNYRISLPEETTRSLVEKRDWDSLLENDQLMMELMSGKLLRGWREGAIKFAPTYKYCPNSDNYYGCFYHGKKAEKKRAPAWCDRIIWYGKGLKQLEYTRSESKLSDHRPVKALFAAQVRVSTELKNLQSLFLSERFEQIKTHFDVAPIDEFVCKKQSSFRL